MRILFVTNVGFPPREGIGGHLAGLAHALRQRGATVEILARGDRILGWQEGVHRNIPYTLYPHPRLKPFHHRLVRPLLDGWLARNTRRFDLVHFHLPLLPPLNTPLPRIVTVHTPMLTDTASVREGRLWPFAMRLNARLFSRGYEQWHLDHADLVLTVSRRVAEELALHYRLGPQQPVVLPNGVDTRFFDFVPLERRAPLLLYVGRLGYRKGLPRLLEAFARLGRRDLDLVLLGEGPLRARLWRRAEELGIAARVLMPGFADRAEVRAWLQRAACLVHPADYEGFPLVLLEAMACGTPVVTTPIGALAELPPRPPLLVAEPDPDAIAEAVARVFATPGLTAVRVAAARALVEQAFDWRVLARRLLDLYGNLFREAA